MNINRKLQLATRAVHNRAAAWFAADGGIFENPFKAQVSVNWGQFHEVKLHLHFNFIRCYACLLFWYIYFEYALPSVLSFKRP
jgi:hypothetical protein